MPSADDRHVGAPGSGPRGRPADWEGICEEVLPDLHPDLRRTVCDVLAGDGSALGRLNPFERLEVLDGVGAVQAWAAWQALADENLRRLQAISGDLEPQLGGKALEPLDFEVLGRIAGLFATSSGGVAAFRKNLTDAIFEPGEPSIPLTSRWPPRDAPHLYNPRSFAAFMRAAMEEVRKGCQLDPDVAPAQAREIERQFRKAATAFLRAVVVEDRERPIRGRRGSQGTRGRFALAAEKILEDQRPDIPKTERARIALQAAQVLGTERVTKKHGDPGERLRKRAHRARTRRR